MNPEKIQYTSIELDVEEQNERIEKQILLSFFGQKLPYYHSVYFYNRNVQKEQLKKFEESIENVFLGPNFEVIVDTKQLYAKYAITLDQKNHSYKFSVGEVNKQTIQIPLLRVTYNGSYKMIEETRDYREHKKDEGELTITLDFKNLYFSKRNGKFEFNIQTPYASAEVPAYYNYLQEWGTANVGVPTKFRNELFNEFIKKSKNLGTD
jgi:hypothetical protein